VRSPKAASGMMMNQANRLNSDVLSVSSSNSKEGRRKAKNNNEGPKNQVNEEDHLKEICEALKIKQS
jgi:hypothetical protein